MYGIFFSKKGRSPCREEHFYSAGSEEKSHDFQDFAENP